MRVPLPLLALLALLVASCPLAAGAAPVTFAVERAASVALAGEVAVTLPEGSGRLLADRTTGEVVLENVTGRLVVWSYVQENAYVHPVDSTLVTPQEQLRDVPYELAGQTLRVRLAAEPFHGRIVTATGGEVSARGPVDAEGAQTRLDAPTSQTLGFNDALPRADTVEWSWDAGWAFVGDYPRADGRLVGFPLALGAAVEARGPVRLQLAGGGNLTFLHEGREVAYRLGNWSEDAAVGAGAAKVRRETVQYVVLDATVARARFPPLDAWGIAAPGAEWTVDGRVAWADASGVLTHEGRERRFEHARVEADGAFTLRPAAGVLADAYAGEGRAQALRIDGVAVRAPAPQQGSPQAAAVVAGGGLLLAYFTTGPGWLAARLALALYSRLTRDDLVQHPARAAILAAVEATPGIHLRELHRAVGGAWGPFTFHLNLLAQRGLLRLAREGKYVLVLPPSGAEAARAPRHPVARRILDALPATGEPVQARALRETLGLSRQVVAYHVAQLEARGLVARDGRTLRRVGPRA